MGGGGDFDMGDADAVGLHGNDLGDEGREVPQVCGLTPGLQAMHVRLYVRMAGY
jgi:hypothetical protein